MQAMEEKIRSEGRILPGGILQVGGFLNQRIDTEFLRQMGEEIKGLYVRDHVNKILTVEASGIAIAVAAGMAMEVPVVFAKKHASSNVDGDVFATMVHSFTHGNDYPMMVAQEYLTRDDRILLIDDFLASGNALRGLAKLSELAGATVVGAAVAIEKKFQGGGNELRQQGIRVTALASIASMEDDQIRFES